MKTSRLTKSKKFKIFLLSCLTAFFFASVCFLAFSAFSFYFAVIRFSENGRSYFFKKSSAIFFNNHGGLKLINPGILSSGLYSSGGFHYDGFYYFLAISVILSLAIITFSFFFVFKIIVKNDDIETTLKSVEKNILEIPSTIIHEIKGNINALSINTAVLSEKIKRSRQNGGIAAVHSDNIGRNSDLDIDRITGVIQSETRKLSETTENILRFTRELFLNIEDVNVNDLISDSAEKSRLKALTKGVFINISSSLDREVCAKLDANLMRQVFTNLISNAVESYEENDKNGDISSGEKSVSIYSFFYINKIVVNIEDKGRGIKKEILKKIYDPFFTTKVNGSGLGLPLVKKILDTHGFKMKIESIVGKGTKVSIVLKSIDN